MFDIFKKKEKLEAAILEKTEIEAGQWEVIGGSRASVWRELKEDKSLLGHYFPDIDWDSVDIDSIHAKFFPNAELQSEDNLHVKVR